MPVKRKKMQRKRMGFEESLEGTERKKGLRDFRRVEGREVRVCFNDLSEENRLERVPGAV